MTGSENHVHTCEPVSITHSSTAAELNRHLCLAQVIVGESLKNVLYASVSERAMRQIVPLSLGVM
jgi:hypothetical protein